MTNALHHARPFRRLLGPVALVAVLSLGASACGGDEAFEGVRAAPPNRPVQLDEGGLGNRGDAPFADVVDDDGLDILGQYDIGTDDELIGDAPEEHLVPWRRFQELIPADLRPDVVQFVAIDSAGSQDSDGAMQVSALDDREYYLALDASGELFGRELDHTIIHEYAHLLTLRDAQVPRGQGDEVQCDVYTLDYACPSEDAYIRAYTKAFWPGYQEADLDDEIASPQDEGAERFTDDEFVTEYAASGPGEDIAETFTFWVFADTEPDGDRIVDRKLRFFSDYPEVAEIRDRIRAAL